MGGDGVIIEVTLSCRFVLYTNGTTKMRTRRILFISVLLNAFGFHSSAQQHQSEPRITSAQSPASHPAATSHPTVTDAETQQIEALIASLRWSGTIGSGHGPLFQMTGNDSAQELARIGAPAIPFLLKALSPVEEANPLAKRRNVVAVTILGEIRDPGAIEGIVSSMDQQWKDALFQRAATSALAKIGDERAIPALKEVGQLSLSVFEVTLSPEIKVGPGADRPLSPKLQWWISDQHVSDVNMAVLWVDAFSAIGEISPDKALEVARPMTLDGNDFGCLGASVLARAAARKNAKYIKEAVSICQIALTTARKPEVKESVNGLLHELEGAGTSRDR